MRDELNVEHDDTRRRAANPLFLWYEYADGDGQRFFDPSAFFFFFQEQLLDSIDLAQYAVRGTEADWDAATKKKKSKNGNLGTVSIKGKVSTVQRSVSTYCIVMLYTIYKQKVTRTYATVLFHGLCTVYVRCRRSGDALDIGSVGRKICMYFVVYSAHTSSKAGKLYFRFCQMSHDAVVWCRLPVCTSSMRW